MLGPSSNKCSFVLWPILTEISRVDVPGCESVVGRLSALEHLWRDLSAEARGRKSGVLIGWQWRIRDELMGC